MRFHLIDRIEALTPGQSLRARKLTSVSETFWAAGPAGPEMPGYLVLEALCQAGTWLVLESTGRRRRAALLSIGSVDFAGPVRPGDVLTLHVTTDGIGADNAVVCGTGHVGQRLVLQAADIMCALVDADELEAAESTSIMGDGLLSTVAVPA
jgi:3-hydroxyacyl-[acyl-carrier-protein] dehydratase